AETAEFMGQAVRRVASLLIDVVQPPAPRKSGAEVFGETVQTLLREAGRFVAGGGPPSADPAALLAMLGAEGDGGGAQGAGPAPASSPAPAPAPAAPEGAVPPGRMPDLGVLFDQLPPEMDNLTIAEMRAHLLQK